MATVLLTTLLNTATHMEPTVAAATTHCPILLHSFCFPGHFALSNTLYNYWFILSIVYCLEKAWRSQLSAARCLQSWQGYGTDTEHTRAFANAWLQGSCAGVETPLRLASLPSHLLWASFPPAACEPGWDPHNHKEIINNQQANEDGNDWVETLSHTTNNLLSICRGKAVSTGLSPEQAPMFLVMPELLETHPWGWSPSSGVHWGLRRPSSSGMSGD